MKSSYKAVQKYNGACSLFPIAFKIGLWSYCLSHSPSKDSQTIESDIQITTNSGNCNIRVQCGTEEVVFLKSLVVIRGNILPYICYLYINIYTHYVLHGASMLSAI